MIISLDLPRWVSSLLILVVAGYVDISVVGVVLLVDLAVELLNSTVFLRCCCPL